MRKIAPSLAIIGLALLFLDAAPAQADASRTWVSGAGDDANTAANCSRTAPCKTFAAAISVTTAGGEINCLDPGGFGGLIIRKAITISCEAGTAGVLVSSGPAIVINATATDVVTLRGLDIDGQRTGGVGIDIGVVGAVHVEKCTLRNFRAPSGAAGINTETNSTTEFLSVVDTVISDNSIGIKLVSAGGYKVASLKNVVIIGSTADGLQLASGNTYANVTDSIISGNGGSAVATLASNTTANIERSTITNNATGLNAAASASIIRISGNGIYNNTNGVLIAQGATIQSDGTNRHGNSNGGAQVPNAGLAQY